MSYFAQTVSRLAPFEEPLIVSGESFDKRNLLELCVRPEIESMFAFLVNAKHIMLFNKPVLPCEVIGGSRIEVNWLDKGTRFTLSDIGPLILDAWVSDIGASSIRTMSGIDASMPIDEWLDVASSISGVIPQDLIVESLFEVAIEQSNLRAADNGYLATAIHAVNARRVDLESHTTFQADPQQDKGALNER